MASEILVGIKVIAAKFATAKKNVKQWAKAGAPIVMFNTGSGIRYRADYEKLYQWLLEQRTRRNIRDGRQTG